MGGGGNIGEESDNPVEINVTAMVDVIFCLCIFFMCSFHFKQLEGRIDAWLPLGKGNQIGAIKEVFLEEIRVFMRWDAASNRTTRKVTNIAVSGDEQLMEEILARKAHYVQAGKSVYPVIIDATPDVPWQDVIHVLDLCKKNNLSSIEFAEPMQFTQRR
jgi:biopolymer transport protein ExbD